MPSIMTQATPQLSFDFTITVSVILAICALISPIITALINNRHHSKIRKLELQHDKDLRSANLMHEILTRQADIYYHDKKEAFSDFLLKAGSFSLEQGRDHPYEALHSSIDKALLFCDPDNQKLLCDFQNYIDVDFFESEDTSHKRSEYSKTLNYLALSLGKELASSKPVIEYESGKC